MTREDLLERVDSSTCCSGVHELALLEVIKLHQYVQAGYRPKGKSGLSKRCTECGFAYPCPTIEAIQTALQ